MPGEHEVTTRDVPRLLVAIDSATSVDAAPLKLDQLQLMARVGVGCVHWIVAVMLTQLGHVTMFCCESILAAKISIGPDDVVVCVILTSPLAAKGIVSLPPEAVDRCARYSLPLTWAKNKLTLNPPAHELRFPMGVALAAVSVEPVSQVVCVAAVPTSSKPELLVPNVTNSVVGSALQA